MFKKNHKTSASRRILYRAFLQFMIYLLTHISFPNLFQPFSGNKVRCIINPTCNRFPLHICSLSEPHTIYLGMQAHTFNLPVTHLCTTMVCCFFFSYSSINSDTVSNGTVWSYVFWSPFWFPYHSEGYRYIRRLISVQKPYIKTLDFD